MPTPHELCRPKTSWGLETTFSTTCPPHALCLKTTTNTNTNIPPTEQTQTLVHACFCEASELLLHTTVDHSNDGGISCDVRAPAIVAITFWACLMVWSLGVGVRMYNTMDFFTPKQRGGYFQRSKLVNLASLLCIAVESLLHLLQAAVVGKDGVRQLQVALSFLLVFTFVLCTLDMIVLLVTVLRRSKNLKMMPNTKDRAALRQFVVEVAIAAITTTLFAVPRALHLEAVSKTILAVIALAILGVYCAVVFWLHNSIKHKKSKLVMVLKPVLSTYQLLTLALAVFVAALIAGTALRFYARSTSPNTTLLGAATFAVSAVEHLAIAAFQFLVTRIANVTYARRRGSNDNSPSFARRPTRTKSNESIHSVRSHHSTRSAPVPRVYYSPSQQHERPHAQSQPHLQSPFDTTPQQTPESHNAQQAPQPHVQPQPHQGKGSNQLPVRPSPLRNQAARFESYSDGEA